MRALATCAMNVTQPLIYFKLRHDAAYISYDGPYSSGASKYGQSSISEVSRIFEKSYIDKDIQTQIYSYRMA